jgi:hypothetical protein
MSWSGWVMCVYLAYGILDLLGSLLFRLSFGLFRGFIPMATILGNLNEGRRVRIGGIRHVIASLLELIPHAIAWPALHLAFRRRFSVEEIVNLRLKRPLEVIQSAWLLVLSALVAIMTEVSGSNFAIRVTCYAIIVTMIAIPLRWVIDGAALRDELRTTLHNPIIQFALVAVASFAALSVTASVLLKVSPNSAFGWGSIWPEALQIWRFGHLSAVWQARPDRAAQISVAIAALAVYALLVSQLSRFWLFSRTDHDRVEISIRLLLADRVDNAKNLLQTVRANDQKVLPELTRAQGMIALKAGDFAGALERALALASLRRLVVSPEYRDDGRWIMAEWAGFFIRVDRGELYAQVISYLVGDGISDPCLATIVPGLVFRTGPIGAGKIASRMKRRVEWMRLRAEMAGKPNATFEGFTRMVASPAKLPDDVSDPPYPLALAMFEGMGGQLSGAAERLLNVKRPRQIPERIVKRVIAGHIIVEAALGEKGLGQAREVASGDILGLLSEVQKLPVARLPWWLREWLQHDIDGRLRSKLLWGGRELAPVLRELRQYLNGHGATTDLQSISVKFSSADSGKDFGYTYRELKDISLKRFGPAVDPNKPIIFGGPDKIRSRATYEGFRYCVRRGSGGRHRDIYVYIDNSAPKRVIATAGRAALEKALDQGDTPARIFVDSSGNTIGTGSGFRFRRVHQK